MQTSNIEMQLSFIAKSLENIDNVTIDTDDLDYDLSELTKAVESLNDDFNEKMDKLIEILSDGRNKYSL